MIQKLDSTICTNFDQIILVDKFVSSYLGMIKPAIQLQETHETFYFIADYHALTSVRDPDQLRENTQDLTASNILHAVLTLSISSTGQIGSARF